MEDEDASGIIQLECDSFNPPATGYTWIKEGPSRDYVSVCHLTGG